MLTITLATALVMVTIWNAPCYSLWYTTWVQTMFIATFSLSLFKWEMELGWTHLNPYLATDPLTNVFLALTCWILPLMIMASQSTLSLHHHYEQRVFLSLLVIMQLILLTAFEALNLLLFFIMFEATVPPTVLIISRWGKQPERLEAALYLLFYTLVGSLPLFVALMLLQKHTGTLSVLILQHPDTLTAVTSNHYLSWMAYLSAFMVKMPLYGVHLWLPKAHVEAPIAGSMILAAVLLKLGGYGIMRILMIAQPLTKELSYPFIVLALWGVIMTGSICLRQTDLKSLIAYSSVSHMGLVVAGILTQTPWGFTGALILMIAHGLTSSALFCLANTNYERTHSRTMILTRGLQMALPLMTAWWFIASLANLALPPLPNLMGELMIITSLLNWSWWTIILTGAGTLITAGYSLYMFLMTQRGPLPPHIINMDPTYTREHLLITLHLLPLALLILKPELIWGWAT
uniref:NADH-ubiquinone oxidoreductase chain 4 n=1 Tax=Hoplolatilus cuniculus TaxID=1206906 RepID=A0A060NU72_9TELE|nr:NADH dehydrogenase subunit 4 [Hoplolatilus cuniculus]BAO84845.1 NADH dehydrogenase subunit 4 [Hoplolatilus cuniculus]